MPELPEVQTTANILNQKIKGLYITDVWSDYNSLFNKGKENIKDPKYFLFFKKELLGKEVLGVRRRAKNVLIDVSEGKTILVHMKMTGHLMYGKYEYINKKWSPIADGPLKDPYNRFIHLVFSFSNGNHMVLSDTRKFAKVIIFDTLSQEKSGISELGPEPLDNAFSYKVFVNAILKKPTGRIKNVLMDQTVISGIGNIYSDEVLWMSSVNPEEIVKNIDDVKLKKIYNNIKLVLQKSIKLGGDSMSDYRNPNGEKGRFQDFHKVYRRKGERCQMKGCKGMIERKIVGGRSAHFCNCHQKLLGSK
jgi:formamidopyrimidine-DNA glycosylase